MYKVTCFRVIPALAVCAIAAPAAYASCQANNIVGTWQDIFGTVATVTSETRGTATAAGIVCAVPGTVYKLSVKPSGGTPPTGAILAGAAPKTSGCSNFKVTLTYPDNSCTTATGTLVFNRIKIQDSWIKQAAQPIRKRPQSPQLTQGLRP